MAARCGAASGDGSGLRCAAAGMAVCVVFYLLRFITTRCALSNFQNSAPQSGTLGSESLSGGSSGGASGSGGEAGGGAPGRKK